MLKKIIKKQKGISLIEVLIALAIMGIIVVGFLMAVNTTAKAVYITDERATAESIARSQLEYIRQQPYQSAEDNDVATYFEISGIQGYSIWSVDRNDDIDNPVEDIIAVPWNSASGAVSVDPGLQRIKLLIMHNDKVVITVEGYKVDEIVYIEG